MPADSVENLVQIALAVAGGPEHEFERAFVVRRDALLFELAEFVAGQAAAAGAVVHLHGALDFDDFPNLQQTGIARGLLAWAEAAGAECLEVSEPVLAKLAAKAPLDPALVAERKAAAEAKAAAQAEKSAARKAAMAASRSPTMRMRTPIAPIRAR